MIAWLCVSVVVSLLAASNSRDGSESVRRDASAHVLEFVASPGFDVPFANNLYEATDCSLTSTDESEAVGRAGRVAPCHTLSGTSRPDSDYALLADTLSPASPLSLYAKHVRLQI